MSLLLVKEIGEWVKFLGWYSARKIRGAGGYIDWSKAIIVEKLMFRRGVYQRPFLHLGMVSVLVLGMVSAPIIVNKYPTQAMGEELASPSEVLNTITASPTSVMTVESEKPRRDVETYVVVAGDTLSTIAAKFNVDVDSVKNLNSSLSSNLHPGDTIKIPPVSGVIVKVKAGDTIYSLAKKYGLPTPQPIVDWPYNDFRNTDTWDLVAGQELVIPGGVMPEAPAPVVRSTPSTSPFVKGSGVLAWPTNGKITQYFAWYHNGVDIANSTGTSVLAADSGRVVSVLYQNFGYGYHVIVDHGNGLKTLYAHLSQIFASVGDNISRGTQLGKMGSTGRSTGPHLHFVVFSNGNSVNPLGLLK